MNENLSNENFDLSVAAALNPNVRDLLTQGVRLTAPRRFQEFREPKMQALETQPLSLNYDNGAYYVYFADGPGEVEYTDFNEAYAAFLDARQA